MDENRFWYLDFESMVTSIFFTLVDHNWDGVEQAILEQRAEEMN